MTDKKQKRSLGGIAMIAVAFIVMFGLLTLDQPIQMLPASAQAGVNELIQGAHTFIGNIVMANTTTIGWDFNTGANSIGAVLLSAPWADLTGIPSGCSSNQFAQTITSSSLGCAGLASVAWSLLTSFPSGCAAFNYITTIATTPTCGQPVINTRVTSPQTATSAAYKSSTLTASLLASTNYDFDAKVYVTEATSSSINFEIHVLASGAALVETCAIGDGATVTAIASGCTATVTTAILTTPPLASPAVYDVSGTITVGSTATTLQIDFADPAAVGTTSVLAGSFVTVHPVT